MHTGNSSRRTARGIACAAVAASALLGGGAAVAQTDDSVAAGLGYSSAPYLGQRQALGYGAEAWA